MRGSWRPNINCNILTPLLWPSALCLSCFPGLLIRRPSGPLCWVMAFFTAPYQQLNSNSNSSGPQGPKAWCHFPIRFLESHVGSSSSGNNCHAVHRPLSSGASVYECTMGIFFTSSHFISQFPPSRFPLITDIRMCHFLPVHHLGMAFLAGSKVKIPK